MCSLRPVADSLTLICRLGLAKKSHCSRMWARRRLKSKSDLRVSRINTTTAWQPPRQRDGHFKERSRQIFEPEPEGICTKDRSKNKQRCKDTQSVALDIPLHKDGRLRPAQQGWAAPTPPGTSSAASNPESPNSQRKLCPPGSSPVPMTQHVSLRLQTEFPACCRAVDQRPKDQKRKCSRRGDLCLLSRKEAPA